MDERIRLAVIALDEAEALHCVEELDDARSLFARQLTLRSGRSALDCHRLTFDAQVGRRDASAAIDEGELQRLTVGQVRKTRLLHRRNVHENVLAAIVTNDEAEAFLRVEELYNALAFADDLGRHSATAAAAATEAAAATTAAAEATASTAAVAAATTTAEAIAATAAAAESVAAAAVSTATAATKAIATTAAEAAAIAIAAAGFTTEEIVALVTAATAAVPLTPFIETHKNPNS
jgi:hypothetical protein